MRGLFFVTLLAMTLMPANMRGQSVQINFDKKIIHCDSLNMPANTSANQMLNMLPELLQRPGITSFTNYEVKVEGMSVNDAKDIALLNLQIEDIEKIEVNESPLSSYLSNGQGGAINIILRKQGKTSSNTWGTAGSTIYSPLDMSQQVLIGHRGNKFIIRGLILGEFSNYSPETTTLNYDNVGKMVQYGIQEKDMRYRSQLARAYMEYNPSQADQLTLNLSETYMYNKTSITNNYLTDQTSSSLSKSVNLHALAKWKHTFSPGRTFLAEAQYIFNPNKKDNIIPAVQTYSSDGTSHTIAGKFEFSSNLQSPSSSTVFKLDAGCNLNGMFSSNEAESFYDYYDINYIYNPKYNTFFVQPYLTLTMNSDKFHLKANVQYQHFRYDIRRNIDEYIKRSNDIIGMITTEYSITPHKTLRLILDRKLNRPSDRQLYPMLDFHPESSCFILGNPQLVPVLSHEIRLDYITDRKWGDNSLMLDISGSYNNINNIISTINERYLSDVIMEEIDCNTYLNNGYNHIYNANLMAQYAYKTFSTSFTGNIYHNEQKVGDNNNHYTYYNLSLYSQFRLNDGWQGLAKCTYYSSVTRKNESLSDCASINMTIGKSFNKLFIYVFDQVPLKKYAEDRATKDNGAYSLSRYDLIATLVGIGAKYSF